jgi:PAS domain S-box-containing protein
MTFPEPARLSSPERIAALRRTALLDTPAELAFDRLTTLATRALGVPVALVSLVDQDRQFFKSCVGLPEPWATTRETPLSHSFCQHVVVQRTPLIVADAREHPHLHENLAIRDLDVVAYAGVPLLTGEGDVLGSFCAIDSRPRAWTATDIEILTGLAASVMTEIELRASVAEQRRARASLQASEERYRLLVDGVGDYAIIMLAPDGGIASWNRGAEAITGYPMQEAIGRSIRFLHEADARSADELAVARARGRHEYTTTRVRRDGSVFPAHVVVTAIRGPDGQLLGYAKVLQDLSEKLATEDELRTLSLVASKTDNAVIITDAAGRIDWVNEGFERISGYTVAECLGEKPGVLLQGPDTDPAAIERIRGHMRRGESFAEEILNYHRDGTPYWISMAVTPIRDEQGRIERFIAIETDITERKAADAELARAKEEAEQANAAKSEFLARMSHELRTPLNAVLGFGQLLLADVQSEEDRESAEQILRAGRHLLDLINEVLDIARIEAGEFSLSVEPVAVSQAVRESVDLVRAFAEERQISLRVEPPSSCDARVMADLQRLKQVLLNLLSNAVKYNRQRGSVTVSCQRSGEGRLRIRVADTGDGIPPEMVGRLFTPFDRLGAEHQGIEGTGLGLALSRKLSEAMGGTMGVESTPGAGTTFWIELAEAALPAPHSDATLHLGLPDTDAIPCSLGRTVLYIEDNLPNCRLVERIFDRMQGVRLIPAMQGRLGIELAQRHLPDLILLDMNLPDLPGAEVLRLLRQHPALRDTPVVVISANAMTDQIRYSEESGVHAHLTKPFNLVDFIEVTERLLRREEIVSC